MTIRSFSKSLDENPKNSSWSKTTLASLSQGLSICTRHCNAKLCLFMLANKKHRQSNARQGKAVKVGD